MLDILNKLIGDDELTLNHVFRCIHTLTNNLLNYSLSAFGAPTQKKPEAYLKEALYTVNTITLLLTHLLKKQENKEIKH